MFRSPALLSSLLCVILFAVFCVLYWPSMSCGFVYDDMARIVENRSAWGLGSGEWLRYNPRRWVAYFTFALNYDLFELKPFGWHVTSVLIHWLATLTLFGFSYRTLRLCGREVREAWLLGAGIAVLWGVHPLQTQSVSYLVQRMESLMGLWYLAAMCLLAWSVPLPKPEEVSEGEEEASLPDSFNWQSSLLLVGSILCGVLSIGSKEVAAMLPLTAVWWDRAFAARSWRELLIKRGWYHGLLAVTLWGIFVVTAGGYLSGSLIHGSDSGVGGVAAAREAAQEFQQQSTDDKTVDQTEADLNRLTPKIYLLTQTEVLCRYLQLSVWPSGQCLDYAWSPVRKVSQAILPGLFILSLVGLTIWATWSHPHWGFLGGWFFLTLAPTSSIVPIRDVIYEHRMYLALASITALAVLGTERLLRVLVQKHHITPAQVPQIGIALLITAAVALSITTHQRNYAWETPLAVWMDVINKAPENPRGYLNAAVQLATITGEYKKAEPIAREAVKRWPNNDDAQNNLGLILVEQGRLKEALPHLQTALKINPSTPKAKTFLNLGNLYQKANQLDKAAGNFRKAIEADPQYSEAYNNLGIVLGRLGQHEEAAEHFQKAVKLNPLNAEAVVSLGNTYLIAGKRGEAMQTYRRALQIKPDSADAHCNLGVALAKDERSLTQAEQHYVAAIKLNPLHINARFNYAKLLVRTKRYQEAIRELQTILKINPNDAEARATLQRLVDALNSR
ncbi:TPR repeat-containing protein YrrB [Calycomorphotria hydatis]|uniref:TPR repeat-containing protein YrrB n=2 Tax=Calycomorphotria hydatis TaxID=2528027 RepID=A0A517T548_9PLAN|nr:TPR repeat-containing protein YrrB [Calycomorphotria hydatis]